MFCCVLSQSNNQHLSEETISRVYGFPGSAETLDRQGGKTNNL